VERRPNRGGATAGTALYLLDPWNGALLDTRSVGSDGLGEDEEGCPAGGCGVMKNALAADAVALRSGDEGSAAVYLGDLDGKLWKTRVRDDPGGPRFDGQPRLLFQGPASAPLFSAVGIVAPGLGLTYVFFGTGSSLLRSDGSSPGLFSLLEGPSGVGQAVPLNLERGPGPGEVLSGAPAVAGEVVFFATTLLARNGCEPPEGRLYALTLSGGTAYDVNRDGRRDADDKVRIRLPARSRLTAPTVADRHLFVAAPDKAEVFGDPQRFNAGPGFSGVRVISWREVGGH
jgi:hypothetical protein